MRGRWNISILLAAYNDRARASRRGVLRRRMRCKLVLSPLGGAMQWEGDRDRRQLNAVASAPSA